MYKTAVLLWIGNVCQQTDELHLSLSGWLYAHGGKGVDGKFLISIIIYWYIDECGEQPYSCVYNQNISTLTLQMKI